MGTFGKNSIFVKLTCGHTWPILSQNGQSEPALKPRSHEAYRLRGIKFSENIKVQHLKIREALNLI